MNSQAERELTTDLFREERAQMMNREHALCAGLFFLKQVFNVSDEELPRRWFENPYWQYFCGERYFRHEFPIHPTSMTRNGVIGCEKKMHRVCYH